ncbi:protein of unknown function [Nannocystis exedens]|uniref:Uncharacterized protein n=1 Tax=Nannocystis exedens TaxID=54 RepID=A0A1I2HGL5_9BACT|nr:DUF4150 domain-containing protein [Nannocystis exedens]PCC67843.1 hypothetical protein NAEX_00851 [Nannocystis exedens]SFF27631.1 protein of unknown function [Nannocystis exedens]
MSSISVNPPKTPVTTGSNGIAAATVPNVCKMPGPPAPFVPTPLPNIAKSGNSPKDFSKNVKFDGCKVAIKGATFTSIGDIASKATGGGIVSANVEGPARFVGPGSMDVKVEGKNVHLLSDPMLNNCGPSGSPPNAATLLGLVQPPGLVALVGDEVCALCHKSHGDKARLEETADTKADASTFQAAATRWRAKIPPDKKNRHKNRPAMLGVVRCRDAVVYAANSGFPIPELQAELPGAWHAPVGLQQQAFQSLIPEDHRETFAVLWEEMREENTAWNARQRDARTDQEAGEPFYPPGSCAAQQAVALALLHGARPVGLTERWSSPAGPNARVFVHFRHRLDGRTKGGYFGGNEAVPPCGTCQVILTMLLCPDEKPSQCDHKSPGSQVCKCTP